MLSEDWASASWGEEGHLVSEHILFVPQAVES